MKAEKLLPGERERKKKQSFQFLWHPFAFFFKAEGGKVIRLTCLDRSGSANILKNNSYSNLWPFGSIINSTKTRGSQTVLPDRKKVSCLCNVCILSGLIAYKQWYHSRATQSDLETYIFIVNLLSPSYSIWFQKKLVCKRDCKARRKLHRPILCLLSLLSITQYRAIFAGSIGCQQTLCVFKKNINGTLAERWTFHIKYIQLQNTWTN